MVQGSNQVQQFGRLSVDPVGRRVAVDHRHLELEPRLFDLLTYLAGSVNTVVTKDDLLNFLAESTYGNLGPAVRNLIAEKGLDPAVIPASRG